MTIALYKKLVTIMLAFIPEEDFINVVSKVGEKNAN
jgi:hypothetical protein